MHEDLQQQLKSEGFPIVYEWEDKPNTEYPLHKHKGKVCFIVTKGSVTFTHGIQKTVAAGNRFDVPPGVEHAAIVGHEGCWYIVGQEIENDA